VMTRTTWASPVAPSGYETDVDERSFGGTMTGSSGGGLGEGAGVAGAGSAEAALAPRATRLAVTATLRRQRSRGDLSIAELCYCQSDA
jgi:hypothetical protein